MLGHAIVRRNDTGRATLPDGRHREGRRVSKGFPGFSEDFFGFFAELAQNNNRAWFTAKKARYRAEVLSPLSDFVAAMGPRLGKISPHYVADPRPNGGSIFRIYRDLRFAKGGKPYKEHGACHFRHEAGKDAHAPGYYVHLEPDQVMFGAGIWKPPSPELRKIREAIAGHQADWKKVVTDKRLKSVYGGVSGDGLTRPPRGFDADHPHIEDIKRRTFFVIRRAEPALAARPDFPDEVAKTFRAATPLMRFLTKAVGAPF